MSLPVRQPAGQVEQVVLGLLQLTELLAPLVERLEDDPHFAVIAHLVQRELQRAGQLTGQPAKPRMVRSRITGLLLRGIEPTLEVLRRSTEAILSGEARSGHRRRAVQDVLVPVAPDIGTELQLRTLHPLDDGGEQATAGCRNLIVAQRVEPVVDPVEQQRAGGQPLLAVDHLEVIQRYLAGLVLHTPATPAKHDRAGVMAPARGQQFQVLPELLEVHRFPRKAPLVVRHIKQPGGQ